MASKTCLQKQLYGSGCEALQAGIRMAGRGAPRGAQFQGFSLRRSTSPRTPAAHARHSAKREAPARQTQSGRKESCAKLSRCPDDGLATMPRTREPVPAARSIFSKGGDGDIDYKAGRAWRGYGIAHSGPLK